MVLRQNTWHYRQFAASYQESRQKKTLPPTSVGICEYVGRIASKLLSDVTAIITVLFLVILALCALIVVFGAVGMMVYVLGLAAAKPSIMASSSPLGPFDPSALWGVLLIATAVALIVFTFKGINRFRRSSTWHVGHAYLAAQKDRVCPRITFEQPPASTDE